MIIPEKPDASDPRVLTTRAGSSQISDTRSIATQEPPPYSETSISLLSGSPPPVIPSSSRPTPSPRPSHYPIPSHPVHPQSQSSQLLVPAPRSRSHSFGAPQQYASPSPSPRPRPHYDPHTVPQPSLPQFGSRSPQAPASPPVQHRHRNSLPGPHASPPVSKLPPSPNPNADAPPPQHCNHLVERNERSSVRGTWYLDTSLFIPEALIPDMSNFNGVWNEMDKKSVKQREREKKKREGGGWGRKKVVDTTPPKLLKNEGVRPNLMLYSKDGGVQAEVNLVSGTNDVAVIVAESHDGSVKLIVNATKPQPVRVYAYSADGSVRVRIPTTFEGAISMTTEDGSVNISEGVRARLMTFSSTNKCVRAYIGDWKGANFGSPTSSPNLSPGSPLTPDSEPKDPFQTWIGPLMHLHAKDGSVNISYVGEDTSGTFTKVMRSIKDGFLGLGMEDEEGNWGNSSMAQVSPATLPLPRGVAMQAYRAPPQIQQPPHPHPHPHAHSQSYPNPQMRSIGPSESGPNTQIPEIGGPGLFEDSKDWKGHGRQYSR
ncbi:hypothetical protein FRC09_000288 [Ceratobasidium sp. 395]|nr:hypothetical protein FRC09_000288 [Ceratobasidium sp. 395]